MGPDPGMRGLIQPVRPCARASQLGIAIITFTSPVTSIMITCLEL